MGLTQTTMVKSWAGRVLSFLLSFYKACLVQTVEQVAAALSEFEWSARLVEEVARQNQHVDLQRMYLPFALAHSLLYAQFCWHVFLEAASQFWLETGAPQFNIDVHKPIMSCYSLQYSESHLPVACSPSVTLYTMM